MFSDNATNEVLLPEAFISQCKTYLARLQKGQIDTITLLEDKVIPSVVILRHDTLEALQQKSSETPVTSQNDHEKFDKAQSMLLTIRNRIHFFENMEEDEILSVVQNVGFLRLKKDDIIFAQNSLGKEIYYIIKGDVAIAGYSDKSHEPDQYTNLTILEDGQVFGELGPILNEGRSARAAVASDEALILSMELVEDETCTNPKAFAKVTKNLMRTLARKLIQTNNQLYPFISD